MYKHILIPTDGSELEPGMVTDTPDGYKKRISHCYREISQGGEGCCHSYGAGGTRAPLRDDCAHPQQHTGWRHSCVTQQRTVAHPKVHTQGHRQIPVAKRAIIMIVTICITP